MKLKHCIRFVATRLYQFFVNCIFMVPISHFWAIFSLQNHLTFCSAPTMYSFKHSCVIHVLFSCTEFSFFSFFVHFNVKTKRFHLFIFLFNILRKIGLCYVRALPHQLSNVSLYVLMPVMWNTSQPKNIKK